MFDQNYILSLILIPPAIICGMLGWVWKKLPLNNRYIPVAVMVLGMILGCIAMGGISLDAIAAGGISGLASTGLHQLFDKIFLDGYVSNGFPMEIEYTTDMAEADLEKNPDLLTPYEEM